MTSTKYQSTLHRYAIATTLVALLAMGIGALVTTKKAGMAFRDWPSSDGHNMLLYPWLQSAGDKFLEHGHRLAGMLIGFFSMGLVAILFWKESRPKVRWVGWLILAAVILQGVLGGMRVLENDERMAMAHGLFAALILSMMASVALFTSRHWVEMSERVVMSDQKKLPSVSHLLPVAILTIIVILAQYLLGGMVRHLGKQLFEHVGLAALVFLCCVTFAVMLFRSGIHWLKNAATVLLLIMGLQISLGLGAFVTKYGFPPMGYVAVQHSILQVMIRTSHTLVGMLLLMTSFTTLWRILYLGSFQTSIPLPMPQVTTANGGVS